MVISKDLSKVYLPETGKPYPNIEDFLSLRFPGIDKKTWIKRIKKGLILTEAGQKLTFGAPYVPYTHLFYYREIEQEPEIPFKEEVIYQDQHFMVACKPHFLPVTPAGKYINECLLVRLKQSTSNHNLSPLHRIDRETAGLVLFSTNKKTRGLYQSMFMNKTIHKSYEAITEYPQNMNSYQAIIRSRIEKGEPWFRMKTCEGTRNTETHVSLLDTKNEKARFKLIPITGKKHQLRIHMSSQGFKIVNDRFYPILLPEKSPDFKKPLQLLAKNIGFTDPISGIKHYFTTNRALDW